MNMGDASGQLDFSMLPKRISALAEMQRGTGAKVHGGIGALPAQTQKIDVEIAVVNQAKAIRELQSAVGRMQAAIEEIAAKLRGVEVLARNGGVV